MQVLLEKKMFRLETEFLYINNTKITLPESHELNYRFLNKYISGSRETGLNEFRNPAYLNNFPYF